MVLCWLGAAPVVIHYPMHRLRMVRSKGRNGIRGLVVWGLVSPISLDASCNISPHMHLYEGPVHVGEDRKLIVGFPHTM